MTPAPAITRALLSWYDRHARALPWRTGAGSRPDPYRVWLSEIMLQQTTVAAVKPYYLRFLTLWPDVRSLADAPREQLLKEWAGLGYYARARNLHACAQAVVERRGGCFPDTESGLRTLPGIGDYTAAAIAAIAFGRPATVVDGNVERVIARLFAIDQPVPAARAAIRALAAPLVPNDRPGDFAQAMMDLGATLCTPRSPACAICPLAANCAARAQGDAAAYPRRKPKAVRPVRRGAVAVISRPDGAVLVRTRPNDGLFGGMTEFLGTPWGSDVPDIATMARAADLSFSHVGDVEHGLTHFSLRLDVYSGRSSGGATPPGCRWVGAAALVEEPLPTLMRKVRDVAWRPSGVLGIEPDSLRLVGFERTDQQGRGQSEHREAEPFQRTGYGNDLSETDGRRRDAEGGQGQDPAQHGKRPA